MADASSITTVALGNASVPSQPIPAAASIVSQNNGISSSCNPGLSATETNCEPNQQFTMQQGIGEQTNQEANLQVPIEAVNAATEGYATEIASSANQPINTSLFDDDSAELLTGLIQNEDFTFPDAGNERWANAAAQARIAPPATSVPVPPALSPFVPAMPMTMAAPTVSAAA